MADYALRILKRDTRITKMMNDDDYWLACLLDPRYKGKLQNIMPHENLELILATKQSTLVDRLLLAFPAHSARDRSHTSSRGQQTRGLWESWVTIYEICHDSSPGFPRKSFSDIYLWLKLPHRSAPVMASHVSQVRALYKKILLLHRTLPLHLKALGDQYVKDEFRRHKSAGQSEAKLFMKEWEDIVPVYQIKGISKLFKLCLPKVQCFCDSLTSPPSERQFNALLMSVASLLANFP
ncbi:unnamed protein product [Ranitomeya imitator]|uniref:Succinate dehydrogenase assembly factor 3 n=1 Tax=Ranitomeya imitator TaxID=111125 RepID=A0ABN9MCB9_9NEOB|nr:unnamed protein product [Ranitomeya imitator]